MSNFKVGRADTALSGFWGQGKEGIPTPIQRVTTDREQLSAGPGCQGEGQGRVSVFGGPGNARY